MIDVDAERARTPGCLDHVFLDSAGSSLPPRSVVDEMVAHLRREAEVGGYRAAAERSADLAALPALVGRLLGAEPETIALTDSATRAWNQFMTALPWREGDRVLISGTEYASNAIALLQRVRADGVSVEVVPSDPLGRIDLEALERALDERVRLVSVVHVPTNRGLVNPVREVVDLAHRTGALVLLDACQSIGQLAIDVADLGVDGLSATGRKWLRGPRGTGVLYVAPHLLDSLEPLAADMRGGTWSGETAYSLRPDAARFELWEYDVAARLGLGAAVAHLLDLGVAAVESAVRARAAGLRDRLRGLPGLVIHDVPESDGPGGIVAFTLAGVEAPEAKARLADAGVTVSVSHRESTRLDMAARGLAGLVRASPHYFNSDADLDTAADAVRRSGVTSR